MTSEEYFHECAFLSKEEALRVVRIEHTFSYCRVGDFESGHNEEIILGIGNTKEGFFHVMAYPTDREECFFDQCVHFNKFRTFEGANKLRNKIVESGEMPSGEYWTCTPSEYWKFSKNNWPEY